MRLVHIVVEGCPSIEDIAALRSTAVAGIDGRAALLADGSTWYETTMGWVQSAGKAKDGPRRFARLARLLSSTKDG